MKKHLITGLITILFLTFVLGLKPDGKKSSTTDQYLVIAWNDLGMHCANLEFANMCILPPYNNQKVHVIRKGDETRPPMAMKGTSGIYVTYEIPGNTYSAGKTNFWDYAYHLFGVTLAPNIGLTGVGLAGTMVKNDTLNYQVVEGIPNTAYPDATLNTPDPYQLTLIKAYSPEGTLLASTQSVIPVSHEINCVSSGCHNSEMAILQKHESVQGFNIADKPILCANCHSDNALGAPGKPGVPPFSQVIHEKHGEFIKSGTTTDCYKCHPGPNTQCWRDVMHTTTGAITKCQDCHGSVYNVGKTIENGRKAWLQEPSCGSANCHGPQYAEEPGKLFRNSKGHGGLFCSTCHNSPHAILPTTEPRDNLQNIALQGFAGTLSQCSVCHGYTPTGPGPHGIPAIKVLETGNITSGQQVCYNATQSVTVAGSGSSFVVNSGANVTMISGGLISFLPGTQVNQGGHLWGYITTKGRYCGSVLPPNRPQANDLEEITSFQEQTESKFSVFPNPTNDRFTVIPNNGIHPGALTVKLISMTGVELSESHVEADSPVSISLQGNQAGIYIVLIRSEGYHEFHKIVKL